MGLRSVKIGMFGELFCVKLLLVIGDRARGNVVQVGKYWLKRHSRQFRTNFFAFKPHCSHPRTWLSTLHWLIGLLHTREDMWRQYRGLLCCVKMQVMPRVNHPAMCYSNTRTRSSLSCLLAFYTIPIFHIF